MRGAKEQIDKLYDITMGQQIIIFGEMSFAKKSVMNISVSLHFDSDIDPIFMQQAIELECLRCDALSVRFTKVDKRMKMYFSKLPPEAIDVVDFSGASEADYDAYMDARTKKVFPNGRCNEQLYRLSLVKKPDGHYALLFVVHHLIMDTYSVFMVFSEILELYDALINGRELPENKNSVLKCYEADKAKREAPDYAEKRAKILKFWDEEVYGTEPLFASVNGRRSKRCQLVSGKRYGATRASAFNTGHHINQWIPAKLVMAVDEYAKEHHVSEQAIFMLAIRSHLSRENGFPEDISLVCSIADRSTVVQRHSGLTRANSLSYRMNFSNELSFEAACETLTTMQMRYYRYSDISVADTTKLFREKFGTPLMHNYYNIMLTYQRYTVQVPKGMQIHAFHHETGIATAPLTMLMIADDNSGRLLCNYDYAVSVIDEKAIYALHESVIEFLTRGLNNPQATLNELMRSYPLKLDVADK